MMPWSDDLTLVPTVSEAVSSCGLTKYSVEIEEWCEPFEHKSGSSKVVATEIQLQQTTNHSLSRYDVVFDPIDRILHLFNSSDDDCNQWQFRLPLPRFSEKLDGSASILDADTGSVGMSLLGVAPMPGVVERLMVQPGDEVIAGQALVTLIAMKMEYIVRASTPSRVVRLDVVEGETVAKGHILVHLEPIEPTKQSVS
ncbi:unnamed protein product [Protopolystoma xenopodis]|uniref:Lipoyl-binding domain-containing protein n=1 Tax=Protopolystoma xenopodis TaxID=117903 RepID=A0A3S5AUR8_9PLAT|nr:unnamed protein product [Protopolystoma xenopodis]